MDREEVFGRCRVVRVLVFEQRVRPHGATSSEASAGGDALRVGRASLEKTSGRIRELKTD